MSEPRKIVVIGSGLAGATAAATVRERGFDGDVLLLGADSHRPYELPPLSKAVLLGNADEPDWVRDEGYWAEHDIRLVSGVTATRVELGARLILDDAGDEHRYDRLILATGSRPRALKVPGGDLPGLYTLRTLDDSLRLRAAFEAAKRVVIVGAGWIGTEAAAAARTHGAEVTVVAPEQLPLANVLGEEIAAVFHRLHTEHGVQWRLGEGVSAITGDTKATGVRLLNGDELPADVVLIAVGAAPNVDLAHVAGLEIADDGGICVDAGLRTAAPDVYAIGDIASQFHPRYGHRVRVEHWATARTQGELVAGNLFGEHEPYLNSPYFFSDQYDPERGGPAIGCEYRGLPNLDRDRVVVRGDLPNYDFTAFWVTPGGEVSAAMNVNQWDDGDALQSLVDNRIVVTDAQVRDGNLAELA